MKVAMTDMDIAWEDKEKNKSLCFVSGDDAHRFFE